MFSFSLKGLKLEIKTLCEIQEGEGGGVRM